MRNPNYAIVKIPEAANVVGFYQLLLEHGFAEVSFVNEVRENAFLPHSEIESAVTSKASTLQNFANGDAKISRNSGGSATMDTATCVPARTNLLCDTRLPKVKALQEARCNNNNNTHPSPTTSPFCGQLFHKT
uniref:Uncharacterized protein n=1 Tax=Ditylenchus dipsaci TaxID=166011 RepID=A0A915DKS4_9BILA